MDMVQMQKVAPRFFLALIAIGMMFFISALMALVTMKSFNPDIAARDAWAYKDKKPHP